MARRNLNGVLLIIFVLVAAGCATVQTAGHKYIMRGQVLDVSDGSAYPCIGSRNGAQVGQELTACRFVRGINPNPKTGIPHFRREETGKVRISEIVDEHYATAKILSGNVRVNDVVELSR